MTFNPEIHHRRSSRLLNYDYASDGAYVVTICTQGRECLFGKIDNETMVLNDAGRMLTSTIRAPIMGAPTEPHKRQKEKRDVTGFYRS